MRNPMRLRLTSALLVLLAASAGCDAVDELLGRNDSDVETLRLEGLAITTDHPADPNVPGGAALATNGAIVRFTATGTFRNLDTDATLEQDVSSAVIWSSTDPSFALPGADARVAVRTTTGSATITASTPAVGDIPAFTSNAITLTAQ